MSIPTMTMTRTIKSVLLIACIFIGWEITASLLYCLIGRQPAAFHWPYDQWLRMVPHIRDNGLMTTVMGLSGGLAALAWGFLAVRLLRRWYGLKGPVSESLFGDSKFNDREAMNRGGFRIGK